MKYKLKRLKPHEVVDFHTNNTDNSNKVIITNSQLLKTIYIDRLIEIANEFKQGGSDETIKLVDMLDVLFIISTNLRGKRTIIKETPDISIQPINDDIMPSFQSILSVLIGNDGVYSNIVEIEKESTPKIDIVEQESSNI